MIRYKLNESIDTNIYVASEGKFEVTVMVHQENFEQLKKALKGLEVISEAPFDEYPKSAKIKVFVRAENREAALKKIQNWIRKDFVLVTRDIFRTHYNTSIKVANKEEAQDFTNYLHWKYDKHDRYGGTFIIPSVQPKYKIQHGDTSPAKIPNNIEYYTVRVDVKAGSHEEAEAILKKEYDTWKKEYRSGPWNVVM